MRRRKPKRAASHAKDPGLAPPGDFRQRKLTVSLWIMSIGIGIAMFWDDVQNYLMGNAFPYNTFLFVPSCRFSDLADTTLMASRTNPYVDPIAFYLPFTWLCMRPFAWMPPNLAMALFFSISLGGLYLVLVKGLEAVLPKTSWRVLVSLLLLFISYPVLFCVDRGNIEILLAMLVALALFCLMKGRYGLSILSLVPAISFKIFPIFLLLLLIRQRKIGWAMAGVLSFLAVTLVSLYGLSLPLGETLKLYSRDAAFYLNNYVYEGWAMENSASLWNAYKVALSTLNLFLSDSLDFDFSSPFIHTSYVIYSTGMLVMAAWISLNALLIEKEIARCAIPILLFMTISIPAAADYRLLYPGIGLILLVISRTRRAHDLLVVAFLALTMVPKKEIILPFAGHTETGFFDVSIQVFLNPIFIACALAILLWTSWGDRDLRWSKLRWGRLLRSAWPWYWTRTA